MALVFLMAGVTKVTDLRGFSDELILHSPLPYAAAVIVAALLPWLELTCGVCLALGYAVREAAALVSGLLVVFFVYALTRGSPEDCGCLLFPKVVELPAWWMPLRDLLLLGCGVVVARGKETLDAQGRTG